MFNNVNNSNNTTHNHMPDTSSSAPTNNRWWENYLVRYLVPSIVGMFILIILNKHTNNSITNLLLSFYSSKSQVELSNSHLIIWFLLGTGFCYISSYPILALHVLVRFSYKGKNHYYRCKMTAITMFPLISSIIIFITIYICSTLDIPFKSNRAEYGIAILVLVLTVSYLLLLMTHIHPKLAKLYLRKLNYRYNLSNTNNQIHDSYKHLREHGNTALIIVFEIILASCLYAPLKIYSASPNIEINFLMYIVFITTITLWLCPAVVIYFFGHALEDAYIGPKKSDIKSNN